MLTRYVANENFVLDGDIFFKGSTFINDDELVGELLHKAGLVSPKPKYTQIDIVDDPYNRVKYLSQMNKTDLLKVAVNENITVDKKANAKIIRAQIKQARAQRGESTR